jgi:hypothetical protein
MGSLPALMLLLALSSTTARAASIVVGDGTPESCTQDAFKQAIADVDTGGTITFNCGTDPITIFIVDGSIEKDLTIDGGGLVTFTGYNPFYIISGTVKFHNVSIANAHGDTAGGIENHGTLTLDHVTLANNGGGHGYGGGGIINDGVLTIEDSTIVENGVGCWYDQCGRGGGILNRGELHVANTSISRNYAAGGGGGMYNMGTATIENSTISENSSGCNVYYNEDGQPVQFCYAGGGIWNSGTVRLINTTVSSNSTGTATGGNGGGIDNSGTLFLQNTTIAYNTARSGGGVMNNSSAIAQNSILAGNTDSNQQPSDCSGSLASVGYNLIGNPGGCTISGDATGDLSNVEPLLGPLQDNGGPTLTHALLPGSPAIDAGNPATPGSGGTACEAIDQRGAARPEDGNRDGLARCDMGALEVPPGTLPVQVDIKPGDSTNPINLQSQGVIPVAIISSSTFDATMMDPASVRFGPGEARSTSSRLEEVNGDGLPDLIMHFRTQQAGIQPGDTQACLTGQTRSGTPIQGCDTIRVLGVSLPPGLILWNTLGSDDEVLNSAFGPDLGFYMRGDCQNVGCLDFVEVKGNPAYIPGVFGNALTLDAGPYFSQARVYNAVLRNASNHISAEQGSVEEWFRETADPLPWTFGIYRLFDGPYGLGDSIGLWVQAQDLYTPGPARLMYNMSYDCYVISQADGQPGVLVSPYNDTWIHVAAVWDRKGIAGTAETLRLYINGDVVASAACTDWPAVFPRSIDIGGGNDDQIDGKFAVDNLKVWDHAKTDYSDRFVEGFKSFRK